MDHQSRQQAQPRPTIAALTVETAADLGISRAFWTVTDRLRGPAGDVLVSLGSVAGTATVHRVVQRDEGAALDAVDAGLAFEHAAEDVIECAIFHEQHYLLSTKSLLIGKVTGSGEIFDGVGTKCLIFCCIVRGGGARAAKSDSRRVASSSDSVGSSRLICSNS